MNSPMDDAGAPDMSKQSKLKVPGVDSPADDMPPMDENKPVSGTYVLKTVDGKSLTLEFTDGLCTKADEAEEPNSKGELPSGGGPTNAPSGGNPGGQGF
jgi:hypothetical protein